MRQECLVIEHFFNMTPPPRPLSLCPFPLQTASIWLKPKTKQRRALTDEGGHVVPQESSEEDQLLAKSRYGWHITLTSSPLVHREPERLTHTHVHALTHAPPYVCPRPYVCCWLW